MHLTDSFDLHMATHDLPRPHKLLADVDPPHWHLAEVVRALRESREQTHKVRHRGYIRELPSRDVMAEVVRGLAAALFPTHYGRPDLSDETIDYFVGQTLEIGRAHV